MSKFNLLLQAHYCHLKGSYSFKKKNDLNGFYQGLFNDNLFPEKKHSKQKMTIIYLIECLFDLILKKGSFQKKLNELRFNYRFISLLTICNPFEPNGKKNFC